MALNLESVGKVWGPYDFTYTERDLMIYALGIGFSRESLEYVYEGNKDFKAFPTYGVVFPNRAAVEAFLSTKPNYAMVVHGEQTLEIHNPLPRSATVSTTAAIEGIYDKGSFRLSTTTIAVNSYATDYTPTTAPGIATHSLTLYRHSSGALVFGAGTINWPWGLDATHDIPGPAADVRMKQATVNLFADMGVQPVTLQPGLVPAAQSTDTLAPTSVILMPPGGTVVAGTTVTTIGTASDAGGGGLPGSSSRLMEARHGIWRAARRTGARRGRPVRRGW